MSLISREDLEAMTDQQLIELEDQLAYEVEVNDNNRSRLSGVKIFNFFLGFIFSMIINVIAFDKLKLGSQFQGSIILIFPYLFGFALGFGLALLLWKILGLTGRSFLRAAMHYWPLTAFLVGIVVYYFKNQP